MHAGDWVDVALLDAIEARAPRRLVGGATATTTARTCGRGCPRWPAPSSAACGSPSCTRPAPATGRERGARAAYPDADVLVFGHSHIPWDTDRPGGLRLLNPGSPTDRRRQPHHTYMTATADGGQLTDVRLHLVAAQG